MVTIWPTTVSGIKNWQDQKAGKCLYFVRKNYLVSIIKTNNLCIMYLPLAIRRNTGKMAKKQSEGARFLLIRHSMYSAILSKIHSYRLLFAHWEKTNL